LVSLRFACSGKGFGVWTEKYEQDFIESELKAPVSAEKHPPLRFLADCHLGKLARHLRFAGFDTLYYSSAEDDALLRLAQLQGRLLLTRDRALAKRDEEQTLLLRSISLEAQLEELAAALPLANHFSPFTRCMVCNTPLQKAEKEAIRSEVPQRVFETFDIFRRCPGCGRIYWQGDHYEAMTRRWREILANVKG
jgi:uncharacterized protein with PIN domain